MKIVVLTHKDVSSWYAATLMERGHEVTIFGGGAIHGHPMKELSDYDGCLLLGDDPDLVEFAGLFEAMGKKVWRHSRTFLRQSPPSLRDANPEECHCAHSSLRLPAKDLDR